MLKLSFMYLAKRNRQGLGLNTHMSIFPGEMKAYVCMNPAIVNTAVCVKTLTDIETLIKDCKREGFVIVDTREEDKKKWL